MVSAQPEPKIQIEDNQLVKIFTPYKLQIVDIWFRMAKQTLNIALPDHELINWLDKYFSAFIEDIEDPTCNPGDIVFIDFASVLQKSGTPLPEAMEVLFLLSHAVKSFEYKQIELGTAINEDNISELSSRVLHVMAKNAANFINQAVMANLQQQERTATLLRVTKAASSSLDLDRVFNIISEEIVHSLGAMACNSFLLPEASKHGHYYFLKPYPPPEYIVPDPPEPFGMEALEKGEPVICYDAATDPRTDKETVRFFNLKSLMSFPIISNGKTLAAGLVVMKDYHHFTQDEIDLVMGIANATAVAIENAQLFEKSKRLAIMEERNRLSVEMHDNLAQALAVLKLDINNLRQQGLPEPACSTLQDMKTLVDETYIELRDTIFGLRVINESDTHFLDNFKNYLATFGIHSGLEIHTAISEEDLQHLSSEAILQVGRIMEEALSNIRKHANARHVWINSGIANETVWISVEDDGNGIDIDNLHGTNQGHFGLSVMAERAEGVGGVIHVGNRADGGTYVRLELPFG